MASSDHRTIRLPGDIRITLVALDGAGTARLLRAAANQAEIYLLYGQTYPAPPNDPARTPSGPGFYVGMSVALRREVRAGISLHQWATQRERLEPTLAILVRRTGRPLPQDITRLIEAHTIRALWLDHTLLNTVSGCPTAARRLTRRQAEFGLWLAAHLVDLVRGQILHGVTGTPTGGTLHEQIVRLVRTQGPMLTTDIVAAAPAAGILLSHHGDPTATVRRDGATRERDSRGPTRIRHTRVLANGRKTGLFYPPWMTRAEAVRSWRASPQVPSHHAVASPPAGDRGPCCAAFSSEEESLAATRHRPRVSRSHPRPQLIEARVGCGASNKRAPASNPDWRHAGADG
jgi:hypothetical protein